MTYSIEQSCVRLHCDDIYSVGIGYDNIVVANQNKNSPWFVYFAYQLWQLKISQ